MEVLNRAFILHGRINTHAERPPAAPCKATNVERIAYQEGQSEGASHCAIVPVDCAMAIRHGLVVQYLQQQPALVSTTQKAKRSARKGLAASSAAIAVRMAVSNGTDPKLFAG